MRDTVDQLVRIRGKQHGDKPVVIDTESRISYAELDDTTRAMAAAFIGAGIGKGTRVTVELPSENRSASISTSASASPAPASSLRSRTARQTK